MAVAGSKRGRCGRILATACLSLIAFAMVATLGHSSAAAQERPRTIIEMLFGGQSRQPERQISRPAPAKKKKTTVRRSAPARAAPSPARPQAAAASAPTEKAGDARTVLVVGDFMADSLADGLEETFADNPRIKVVGHVNGSSGLVRDDHYDWLQNIGPILDEAKPAVVVVMLGSNDRQAIAAPSGSLALRSEQWTAEYERRATALAQAIAQKNVPLVWVGVPAFKFERMSEDMVFFNGIYGKAAASVSGDFVDIWDGFVDAQGAFVYNGPDISGQSVRLRNSDGITMTGAGREKLAFFAERPILKRLDMDASIASSDASITLSPETLPSLRLPPLGSAANATSKPSIALNDPALDGGDELLGGQATPTLSIEPSPRERLVVLGATIDSVEGRADDFAWNEKDDAVSPRLSEEAVVARGSVDLGDLNRKTALPPMPSLQDAIIEDWAKQSESDAETAEPNAAGPAN
ncbi:SGNH/GDSL hydrolase family protein [Consotaella aegiceratis]|uniref:SGNH/GDSL hydrolase family protein n=1 Tax=Consotaella aegiceratis TaxID=3097961 RepID=UPI002F428EC9